MVGHPPMDSPAHVRVQLNHIVTSDTPHGDQHSFLMVVCDAWKRVGQYVCMRVVWVCECVEGDEVQ